MKKYIYIFIILGIAFLISLYAVNNIFLAYTPKLNPNYLSNLQNNINKGINSIYLALKSLNKSKDVAKVKPTITPSMTNDNFMPTITNYVKPTSYANIDPAKIPEFLFQSISKGVSAYEEDDTTIVKIENGTTYRAKQLKLSNGKIINIIDLTSQ